MQVITTIHDKGVAIDSQVAKAGGLYRRDFGKSHGVGLADAVVAASAVASNTTVKTPNVRHYPMFIGLEPAYRK